MEPLDIEHVIKNDRVEVFILRQFMDPEHATQLHDHLNTKAQWTDCKYK